MISLLARCVHLGASDLHLLAEHYPVFRVEGDLLSDETFGYIDAKALDVFLSTMLTQAQLQAFKKNKELDFFYESERTYFRVNAYFSKGEVACNLRVVPRDIPLLETLGVPSVFRDMLHKKQGLILVTGATGSGKSTSIAAMLEEINNTQKKHIITIEDPVEFIFESKKSIFSQRSVGSDTESFSAALKYALRQDPDVIVIGELRDRETMRMALDAALSGHLVLASLHTNSASGTLQRILNSFESAHAQMIQSTLSQALLGIISQALIPTGAKRIGAFEVMLNTPAIANLIREGKTHQIDNTIALDRQSGMVLMDDALYTLYQEQVISKESALNYAHASDALKKRIV